MFEAEPLVPRTSEQDDQELEATSNLVLSTERLGIPLQTPEESFDFPDEEEEEKVDSCSSGGRGLVPGHDEQPIVAIVAAPIVAIVAAPGVRSGDSCRPRPSVYHVWSLKNKTWMDSRSLCAMFSAHSAETLSKDRLNKIIDNHKKEERVSGECDDSPSAERVGPGYYIVNVWRVEERDDVTHAVTSVTFQFYIGEVFKMTTVAGKALVFAIPLNKLPPGLAVGVRWLTPIVVAGDSPLSAIRYRISPDLECIDVEGKDILGTVVFERSKDDDRSVLWLTEASLERCKQLAKVYELQWIAQNEPVCESPAVEVGATTRKRAQNAKAATKAPDSAAKTA